MHYDVHSRGRSSAPCAAARALWRTSAAARPTTPRSLCPGPGGKSMEIFGKSMEINLKL